MVDDSRRILFLQELVVSKKPEVQSRTQSYIFSIGAEMRSGENQWVEFETGVISGLWPEHPGIFHGAVKNSASGAQGDEIAPLQWMCLFTWIFIVLIILERPRHAPSQLFWTVAEDRLLQQFIRRGWLFPYR